MVAVSKKIFYSSPQVDDSEQKRDVTNVPLKPSARALIEGLREDTGIPKVEALTRILEWFFSLDRKLRFAVLNRDEATQREMMQILIQQMSGVNDVTAASATTGVTAEEAAAGIHALADRLLFDVNVKRKALSQLLAAAKKK